MQLDDQPSHTLPHGDAKIFIGVALLWLAFLICGALYFVPLTYDETYNYRAYATQSAWQILTDYSAPNNHILYSLLSTFVAPMWVSDLVPRAIRSANVIVGFVAFLVVAILCRREMRTRPFLTLAILLASPIASLYLFVARGYLLGSFLTLLTAYLLSRESKQSWWGVVTAVLAVACVPTFGTHLAGFFAILVVLRPLRALLQVGSIGLLLTALYLNKLSQILKFARLDGENPQPIIVRWDYMIEVLRYVTTVFSDRSPPWLQPVVPWVGGGLIVTLAIGAVSLFVRFHRVQPPLYQIRESGIVVALCCAGAVSYLFITSLLQSVFMRNSIGVGMLVWFGVAQLVCASPSRILRCALTSLLTLSATFSIYQFAHDFVVPADPTENHLILTGCPMPIGWYWAEIERDVVQIDCRESSSVVCDAYHPLIMKAKILRGAIPDAPAQCVYGRTYSPELTNLKSEIFVRLRDGREGRVCF